jgi:rod shape-determining protein MreD
MTDRTKARLRIIVLLLIAFGLQSTVASDLRIQGVAPDFLLVAAVCAGLAGGARQGMLVGFASGLLADLYLTDTPVGLCALVFCLVGYGVGTLRENVVPDGWILTPILALAATGIGVALFVGIGDIVGQTQLVAAGRNALIRTALIESLWSAVVAVPVAWLFGWAARGSAGATALDRGRSDRIGVR